MSRNKNKCPTCGTRYKPTQRSCNRCGHKFDRTIKLTNLFDGVQ